MKKRTHNIFGAAIERKKETSDTGSQISKYSSNSRIRRRIVTLEPPPEASPSPKAPDMRRRPKFNLDFSKLPKGKPYPLYKQKQANQDSKRSNDPKGPHPSTPKFEDNIFQKSIDSKLQLNKQLSKESYGIKATK